MQRPALAVEPLCASDTNVRHDICHALVNNMTDMMSAIFDIIRQELRTICMHLSRMLAMSGSQEGYCHREAFGAQDLQARSVQ